MAELHSLQHSDNTPDKHVIFVHGLNGHFTETWKSSDDVIWPTWLGEDLTNTATWSVEYNAKKFGNDSMHLVRRGANVFELLLTYPELQHGEIVLVGHSFGGLVIKQLLRYASNQLTERSDAKAFLKRVRKVVFLGTPHTGSSLATLSDRLRVVLTNSGVTQSLKKDDPHLVDLKRWYKNWSVENGIQNLALMEDRKTVFKWGPFRKSVWVVESDSADPGLKEDAIMVDADHFQICKPKSKSSEVYRHISCFIEKKNRFISQQDRIELKFEDLNHELEQIHSSISVLDPLTNNTSELPVELIDKEVFKQLETIVDCRFFSIFPTSKLSTQLGERILDKGDFSKSSIEIRSRACAWLARLLSFDTDKSELANQLLTKSKQLSELDEQVIAEAFLKSNENNVREIVGNLLEEKTPERLSAALMMLRRYDSTLALNWYIESSTSIENLSTDGQVTLLSLLLAEERWEIAEVEVNKLLRGGIPNSSALKFHTALLLICISVAVSVRKEIAKGVPILAPNFPFKSDSKSLEYRRKAVELFREASEKLSVLKLDKVSNLAFDYALWIEINDRDNFSKAKLLVEEILSDSENLDTAIRIVPIIVELDIDLGLIKSEVDKRVALTLGEDFYSVIAKFALLLRETKPEVVINEIENNEAVFLKYIAPHSICGIKVQAYCYLNKNDIALKEVNELLNDNALTDIQFEHLTSLINLDNVDESISILERKYIEDQSLDSLNILISSLAKIGDSRLQNYQELYFSKTNNIVALENLVETLTVNSDFDKLHNILVNNAELIEQSNKLKVHLGWSYFRNGQVKECEEVLNKYSDNNATFDDLQDSLNLCTGDWESLAKNIEVAWDNRENLSPNELFRKSYLAEAVLPHRAGDFITEAVTKQPNNPEILTSAYSVATSLGLDNKAEVQSWLQKAIELSEGGGPIVQLSIDELPEYIGENKDRPNRAWTEFLAGNAPTTLVASLLNRSISSFYITPWVMNSNQIDVSRKVAIPAYSLNRGLVDNEMPQTIALDLTSIFTLSNVNLLDKVIESFEQVVIPHSTLRTIFDDRKKTAFHQPSQISLAKSLLNETKGFNKFVYKGNDDIELRAKINDEAADFISHSMSSEKNVNRLAAISRPQYVSNSLMKKEFDLTPYNEVIVSCEQIIKALYMQGLLMEHEAIEKLLDISSLLRLDNIKVEFSLDSELYIDRLTCQRLHRIGILELLSKSNFKCFISESQEVENNNLVNYEEVNTKVISQLDSIRSTLKKYIKSGLVSLTAMNIKDLEDESYSNCIELVTSNIQVDAVVSDDRFLNKHKNIRLVNHEAPVLTSMDLFSILHNSDRLSENEYLRVRLSLLKNAYIFPSLNKNELDRIFDNASFNASGLVESAEIKAIKHNIILIKASDYIELPRDAQWLVSLMSFLSRYLKQIWDRYEDDSKCKAISNWLYQLMDYKTWAGCYSNDVGENFVLNAEMLRINSVLNSSEINRKERKSAYKNWLETFVLENARYEHPYLYRSLVTTTRQMTLKTAKDLLNGKDEL
ncbi:esterase/lipase family protein [Vibrio parahaemolyticus]|uniref:esterase/lipase family protein n=1 Tax=Vibrio parahaemolyticus TaxID=670 RepID=UPI002361519F|nr:hypothetical protein [Vibrio parahaemolyticus]